MPTEDARAALVDADIRNAFMQTNVWLAGISFKDYGAAFDRWLVAHDAALVAQGEAPPPTEPSEAEVDAVKRAIHGAILGSGTYESWLAGESDGFMMLDDMARAAIAAAHRTQEGHERD